MYYKIINKECAIYKQLYAMRLRELAINAQNRIAIEEKTGHKWSNWVGYGRQTTWWRTHMYLEFAFVNPETLDLKVWKFNPESKCFCTNKRTKVGREMQSFLDRLPKGNQIEIWKTFNTELPVAPQSFKFPFLEITTAENILVLFLDSAIEPESEDVIEITSKEFEALRQEDAVISETELLNLKIS